MGDFIIQKKAAGNFSLFPEKVSHIYTQINFCSFTLTSFNTNQKPYFFFPIPMLNNQGQHCNDVFLSAMPFFLSSEISCPLFHRTFLPMCVLTCATEKSLMHKFDDDIS